MRAALELGVLLLANYSHEEGMTGKLAWGVAVFAVPCLPGPFVFIRSFKNTPKHRGSFGGMCSQLVKALDPEHPTLYLTCLWKCHTEASGFALLKHNNIFRKQRVSGPPREVLVQTGLRTIK